ncbi:MAG: tRNA pseudouridine(38-40) synthase TruA [Bacteroidota bacterium]
MQRYFIELSYKGTNFHGWQSQSNAVSVQDVLENAISLKLSEKIGLTGAGRTDTGVHASYYVAHFDSMHEKLDMNVKFLTGLNRFLPMDIAVSRIRKVRNDVHSRFDAVSRTYKYYISQCKNPFHTETAWYIHSPLNIDRMKKYAVILMEYDDFGSFCKLHSDNKTNICKIMHAGWTEEKGMLVFTITADRFLRNMVRAIVGTLVDAGKEKIDEAGFRKIIKACDRKKAGTSAPAQGLFLTDIEYPGEVYEL